MSICSFDFSYCIVTELSVCDTFNHLLSKVAQYFCNSTRAAHSTLRPRGVRTLNVKSTPSGESTLHHALLIKTLGFNSGSFIQQAE